METPDEQGDKGDHVCCNECDKDDADAVCIAERSRVVVDCRDNDGTDHHEPVCDRDVHLAVEFLGSVDHTGDDQWPIRKILMRGAYLMCGKYEAFMTCDRSWKVEVMSACDATTAARTEITSDG